MSKEEDYSSTPAITKQTLKQNINLDNHIPDAEPTDVVTGYNGKEETVLNIHTTDKAVVNNQIKMPPSKQLNLNRIEVVDIVIFDEMISSIPIQFKRYLGFNNKMQEEIICCGLKRKLIQIWRGVVRLFFFPSVCLGLFTFCKGFLFKQL